MRTSVPCPSCEEAITLEDFEDFSSYFTAKCPYCKAKLKFTKVMPYLIIGTIIVVPILIYLTIKIQEFLANYIPVVEKVPTIFVFLAFLYPVYALFERLNGLIVFNKGEIVLKKEKERA